MYTEAKKRLARFSLPIIAVLLLSFPAMAAEEQSPVSGSTEVGSTETGQITVVDELNMEDAGPGQLLIKKESAPVEDEDNRGDSLGVFKVTAYCSCPLCSSGNNLTYSGTVPRARHTLSADLTILPLGTKVLIDDIVYTVEDMGGGVNGQTVDIYFDSHEEALAYGTKKQEVFAVED